MCFVVVFRMPAEVVFSEDYNTTKVAVAHDMQGGHFLQHSVGLHVRQCCRMKTLQINLALYHCKLSHTTIVAADKAKLHEAISDYLSLSTIDLVKIAILLQQLLGMLFVCLHTWEGCEQ